MNTIDMDSERAPAQPGREEMGRPGINEEQQRLDVPSDNAPEPPAALPQSTAGALARPDVDAAAASSKDAAAPRRAEPIDPLGAAPQPSGAQPPVAAPGDAADRRRPDDEATRPEPPSGANTRMPGAEAALIGAAFVASLETRMAKSGLEERGWRDRADLAPVMRDLEVLAGVSWKAAANLWDKYRPGDPDKPIFIDGDDKDAARRSEHRETPAAGEPAFNAPASARAKAQRSTSDLSVTPTVLAKRYLVEENKFYFRDDPNLLAFEDKGKRISTAHNDPLVARSMVELAAAKQWTSVRVKGTDDFRREVWLAASLRGMDVEGYTPREVDTARLAELRAQLQPTRQNAIEQALERRSSPAPAAPARQQAPLERPLDQSSEGQPQAYRSLSKQQRVAVDTLRAILTERGDPAKAVAMAVELATERFQQQRVYVGRLVDHGSAPYEHNPNEKQNYFVTLTTINGDRTIWGVDLERALSEGRITPGDDVALLYRGRQPVTITDQVREPGGQSTQKVTKIVNRNAWEAGKLDQLRSEARERVRIAAEASEHSQPVVPVYDLPARRQPPHQDKERAEKPLSR